MHKILILAAVGAVALAGCNSEPEVIDEYDPQAAALKNAAPVELPPSIVASRTYRCRDNSLVYVDFLSNGTANIRNDEGGAPVATLTAEGGTPPYTGSGYSVSANAAEIRYTAPGRGSQTCRE